MGEGNYLDVDGNKIYYEKHGSGEKIIVLLPGVLGTLETDFDTIIKGFDLTKYTLIGWDPPGYGKSRPPDKVFKDWYKVDAQLALKFFDLLGLDKFCLLGYSDGARTALYVASWAPEKIEKLVVWGVSTYITPKERRWISLIRDVSGWSNERRDIFEKIYGNDLQTIWGKWCDSYIGTLAIPRDVVAKIKSPTLILQGEKDIITSVEPHLNFMKTAIKGSKTYLFKNASHGCHQDYPAQFNKMVMDFLDK